MLPVSEFTHHFFSDSLSFMGRLKNSFFCVPGFGFVDSSSFGAQLIEVFFLTSAFFHTIVLFVCVVDWCRYKCL